VPAAAKTFENLLKQVKLPEMPGLHSLLSRLPARVNIFSNSLRDDLSSIDSFFFFIIIKKNDVDFAKHSLFVRIASLKNGNCH